MEPSDGEDLLEQAKRMRKRRLEDAAGRPPHLLVADVEVRRGAVEVRDDDLHRKRGRGDACRRDRPSDEPAPPRDRVPDAEAREHERDLLLRRRGCDRAGCERQPALLVKEPEGEEQQRARERDRMELVQRQPARRGVEQIGERKAEARAG